MVRKKLLNVLQIATCPMCGMYVYVYVRIRMRRRKKHYHNDDDADGQRSKKSAKNALIEWLLLIRSWE